jgi:hypothetical protein
VIACVVLDGSCALWWHRLQPVRVSDCSPQSDVGQVGNLRPIVNRPARDDNKRLVAARPLCTTRPENPYSPQRNCRAGLQPAADFQLACRGQETGALMVAAPLLCTTRPENPNSPRRNCRAGLQPAADFQSACRGQETGAPMVAAPLLCGAANPGCSRLSSRLVAPTRHENSRIKAACTQDCLPHHHPTRAQAAAIPRVHVALGTAACRAETSGRLDAWPSLVQGVGAPHGGGPCRHAS